MPSTSSEPTEDFSEEAHLAPNASEEVDFRLRFGGGSSTSSLLLSLVELAFERFPPSLLVLGAKILVIFDMMTGKPGEMLEQKYSVIIKVTFQIARDVRKRFLPLTATCTSARA